MNSNFEIFAQAYQKAPQNIRQLIDSETIGEFADVLVNQYSLPKDTKRTLLIIVSNKILNLISDGEIVASLQNLKLSPEVVDDLASKIESFVQHKTGTAAQATIPAATAPGSNIPKPATLAEQARTTATIPIPPVKPTSGVSTIRTMAGDVAKAQKNSETVYTSTQEAILKEGWSTPKPSD